WRGSCDRSRPVLRRGCVRAAGPGRRLRDLGGTRPDRDGAGPRVPALLAERIVRRGEAVVIPPNVPHGARTHDTTCLEVDVFHPPPRGLLEAMGKADPSSRQAG